MLDAKKVTGEFPGRYLRSVDVQWDTVTALISTAVTGKIDVRG